MQAKYRIVSGLWVDNHAIVSIKLQQLVLGFIWLTIDYEYAFAYDSQDTANMIERLKRTLARIVKVKNTKVPAINLKFDKDGNEIV